MRMYENQNEIKKILRRLNVNELIKILTRCGLNTNIRTSRSKIMESVFLLLENTDEYISSTTASVIRETYYKSTRKPNYSLTDSLIHIQNNKGYKSKIEEKGNCGKSLSIFHGNKMRKINICKMPLHIYENILYESILTKINNKDMNKLNDISELISFKLGEYYHILNNKNNNESSNKYDIYLRIGIFNIDTNLYEDIIPKNIIIRINRIQVCNKDLYSKIDENLICREPINITSYCMMNPLTINYLKISLSSINYNQEIIASIFIGKLNSFNDFLFDLKHNELNKNDFDKLIKIKLTNKDDDVEGEQRIIYPFTCPISLLRMNIPARFSTCSHIECFDLNSFYTIMKLIPNWVCPICEVQRNYTDLYIDRYFSNIMNQYPNYKDLEINILGKERLFKPINIIETFEPDFFDDKDKIKIDNISNASPDDNDVIIID